MRAPLRALLNAVRTLRMLGWRLATAARLRWSGMKLELRVDGPPPSSLPRVRTSHEGDRGGRLVLSVGRGARLGRAVEVEVRRGAENLLELGDDVQVSSNVAFKLRGGAIRIGAGTVVRDWVILKAAGRLVVGTSCTISYQVIVHCEEAVTVGDDIALGERTTVVDSSHEPDRSELPWYRQPAPTEPVEIGRNTLVLANCLILRGTRLGANCVVAAGSTVHGEYPAGSLIAGTPAEVVRSSE